MKRLSKHLATLFTLSILTVFVWYLITNFDTFQELLSISPWVWITLLVLNTVRIHNNGSFLKYTLEFYKKHIDSRESFYIALLTTIGNFFGPFMGGAGIRAVYLKRQHKLSYTDFAATLSGFYFITFIVNSAIGLAALIVIHLQTSVVSPVVYLVFAGWLISSVVLAEVRNIDKILLFIERRLPIAHKPFKFTNNAIKGWGQIKSDKRLFYRLNRLTVYGFLILYVITYVEFRAIGADPSIASISLYVTLSALSLLVSVTPSAIGIREAIFIFTSALIGLNTDQILALAVIDRAATFVVLFVGYLILKSHGVYKTKYLSDKPAAD